MNKKVLGIIAASVVAITAAGCGSKADTNATTTTTTTTKETTTTSTQVTSSATEATKVETTPISQFYNVSVKKTADGFKELGNYSYKSSNGSSYTYTMLDDVSPHAMQASLDSLMAQLTDAVPGVKDDIYYVSGKKDGINFIRAYKSVGLGKDLNCYICIEYMSNSDIDINKVLDLISNEYLDISAK